MYFLKRVDLMRRNSKLMGEMNPSGRKRKRKRISKEETRELADICSGERRSFGPRYFPILHLLRTNASRLARKTIDGFTCLSGYIPCIPCYSEEPIYQQRKSVLWRLTRIINQDHQGACALVNL